ncbi:plancitoxin-1 [Phymastichus coffea]|uniref:plancitoxin-1 n=1 Tax=Phymastichus coffea TaxID=108790 RepID=UPI00273B940F|nr:plancitoxin-1 [Phymastichus coffea]
MTLLKTKTLFYNAFITIIFINNISSASSLQCKGENNQDVDWYILYKIPKILNSSDPLIREGVAYLYMDSESFTNGWTLSHQDITSNNSIPAYTLAPLYKDRDANNLIWLLYNDQPPNQPATLNNGHTKGAIIANEKSGFWLIHSVPNFPPQPNTGEKVQSVRSSKSEDDKDVEKSNVVVPTGGYAYPSSGKQNGQSFLCISTNDLNFDIIGKQLMYNQIIVYRRNIPENLSNKYSILAKAAQQTHVKKAPFNNKESIYSTSRMEFMTFAKSSKWGKDLYDDFVAPQLGIDMYAETWLNGRGRLPSECNHTRVLNVHSISLTEAKVHFKSSHDHSKWAVAIDGKQKATWVCVGDINRAKTQFDRGGGTVCFNSPEVWKNYKNSIDDVEPCPKTNSKDFMSRLRSWLYF